MMGMPSCREISRAVASDALEGAPMRRRLGVRMHLLMCRHCRRYARQIRALGRAAREVLAQPSEEAASLERLRHTLLERLETPPGSGT